jgi:hypothetical protein
MFRLTNVNPKVNSESWIADFANYRDALDFIEKLELDKIIARVSTSTTENTTYALLNGEYYQIKKVMN